MGMRTKDRKWVTRRFCKNIACESFRDEMARSFNPRTTMIEDGLKDTIRELHTTGNVFFPFRYLKHASVIPKVLFKRRLAKCCQVIRQGFQ